MSVTTKSHIVLGCVFLLCLSTPTWSNPVAGYRLDATFHPDDAAMEGEAEIWLNRDHRFGEDITFYLHGELQVTSVRQGDTEIPFVDDQVFFEYDGSLVARTAAIPSKMVDLSTPIHLAWKGHFHQSTAVAQSNFMRIDATGVYLRAYYYSLWFPVVLNAAEDHYPVDFHQVVLRTPQRLLPVFTGKRLSEAVQDGWTISTWQAMQTSIADAQVIAREYEITRGGGITVYHLKNASSRAAAAKATETGRKIIELMRRWYGPDAKVKESVLMEMPEYGDIGSGNIVGVAGGFWEGTAEGTRFFNTYNHELVHDFVQIPMERTNPLYAFCIESVPAYYHMPVMSELFGAEYYDRYISRQEAEYLYQKEHGTTRRGMTLPQEKPIAKITADEIGEYKDFSVLAHRARLFLHSLRSAMGEERFLEFTRDYVGRRNISLEQYADLVEKYLPDSRGDVLTWLATTEYPERFRLNAPAKE